MSQPRVALIHDRLTEWGGAENVLAEFLMQWPDATVYSPMVDPDVVRDKLGLVKDTWLSDAYARIGKRSHAPLLPFVPHAGGKRRDCSKAGDRLSEGGDRGHPHAGDRADHPPRREGVT